MIKCYRCCFLITKGSNQESFSFLTSVSDAPVLRPDVIIMTLHFCLVDKLLSNEDGGGIFDDPPAIAESVMMPQEHGEEEDEFDALSGQLHRPLSTRH